MAPPFILLLSAWTFQIFGHYPWRQRLCFFQRYALAFTARTLRCPLLFFIYQECATAIFALIFFTWHYLTSLSFLLLWVYYTISSMCRHLHRFASSVVKILSGFFLCFRSFSCPPLSIKNRYVSIHIIGNYSWNLLHFFYSYDCSTIHPFETIICERNSPAPEGSKR